MAPVGSRDRRRKKIGTVDRANNGSRRAERTSSEVLSRAVVWPVGGKHRGDSRRR